MSEDGCGFEPSVPGILQIVDIAVNLGVGFKMHHALRYFTIKYKQTQFIFSLSLNSIAFQSSH